MKIKNNTVLCVFALSTLAAGFGSCQSEDDALNGLPQGSVPLVLGDVTVAGAQTVNTRAAGGSTRAAISENATGYTGIRKSRFVEGDALNLTLSNGSGGSAVTTSVTATLTGGKWVLTPGKVFITPGVTEISATHTAVEQTAGIATDDLAAANADCALTAATGTLSIGMKHARAIIDITPGATDGGAITSVMVNTDVPTAPEEEAVAGGSGTMMHYRTLTADATVVSSISAVIGGTTYVATLATPLTVAANKRYPVALTFKAQTLTATVSAPQDWTDGGTVPVLGYTYIIDSPEALAQLAADVNSGELRNSISILQTADIDLSKLKPLADAGTNPLTGTAYTYTATKDSWVPIGNEVHGFWHKYNGNGHTISNLKGSGGLFGFVSQSLIGIHLRNVTLTGVKGNVGALMNTAGGEFSVTLCSATGSITAAADATESHIGGLIGYLFYGAGTPHITRCSADVDIDASALTANGNVGGFAGYMDDSYVIGCMAMGNVTGGNLYAGGFVGRNRNYATSCCMATGNVTGTKSAAFAGKHEGGPISACYATGTVGTANSNFVYETAADLATTTDCAYTGTQTSTVTGVTGSLATPDLYATLTATSASVANLKTLHWSAADGYTLTEVTKTWYATDIWKDNGTAAPTIDMSYEGYDGPLYNGAKPNLLAIPGKVAYWVAPEDASTGTLWANIDFSTICPEGWHVPTVEEFRAMTGITMSGVLVDTNHAAIKAAFPENIYWSSSGPSSSYIWSMEVAASGTKFGSSLDKSNHVRCVQTK